MLQPSMVRQRSYVCAVFQEPERCLGAHRRQQNHGDIDLGIAVEHLCLAAADRGLGSCWVCNYDVEAVKRLFPIEGYEAVAIVPIGHIAHDCPHPEKKRKEINNIFEEV